MAASRKDDAAAILSHLRKLPLIHKLDKRRAQWPRFVYRFDDIRNIAQILRDGRLLSRALCDAKGVLHHDAAAKEIIKQSPVAHRYARLYFRPRTPTQFRMEGIRTKAQLWNEAHCPVPVFLLFDAERILVREDAMFSTGSMANQTTYPATTGVDARFFRRMPFDLIYHDGPIRQAEDKLLIKARRHAEVLFESQLDLGDLGSVVCRTGPERLTLLSLLKELASEWEPRIRVEAPGEGLFDRVGTFVNDVRLDRDRLFIDLEPRPGPFDVKLTVWDADDRTVLRTVAKPIAEARTRHVAPLIRSPERVYVRLELEGALAFESIVTQRSLYTS